VKRLAVSFVVTLAFTTEVRAQTPAGAPMPAAGPAAAPAPADRAEPRSETSGDPRRSATPTFEVTAKNNGEGKIRLGADLLLPFEDQLHEAHVKLALEAASRDGLSTILSGTSKGFETESSVSATFDVVYTTLQSPARIVPKLPDAVIPADKRMKPDSLTIPERRALLLECLNTSENGHEWELPKVSGLPPDVKQDVDDDRYVEEVDGRLYCHKAMPKLIAAEHERKLPLPRQQLAFSFTVGRSTFQQLSPTSDPMVLHVTKAREPQISAAMAFAGYAPAERYSLELATRLDSSFTASSKTARWCGSAGSVTRPDGGMDPAQSCSELPLGDPTRTTTSASAAYVGFVGSDYNWRIAMGPIAKFGFGGHNVSYDIGFEIPFYFVRSSPGFSGVVRIAPAALSTRDVDGKQDSKVLLTLTLLGARTLFDTAFH
jgi:hypothetical protein